MDDKNILDRIQKSAQDIEIPERLRPEEILKRIEELEKENKSAFDSSRMKRKKISVFLYGSWAAVAVIVFLGASMAAPVFFKTEKKGTEITTGKAASEAAIPEESVEEKAIQEAADPEEVIQGAMVRGDMASEEMMQEETVEEEMRIEDADQAAGSAWMDEGEELCEDVKSETIHEAAEICEDAEAESEFLAADTDVPKDGGVMQEDSPAPARTSISDMIHRIFRKFFLIFQKLKQ